MIHLRIQLPSIPFRNYRRASIAFLCSVKSASSISKTQLPKLSSKYPILLLLFDQSGSYIIVQNTHDELISWDPS